MKENSWEKPNLIVLGRGTPEEHVLSSCKHPKLGGGPGGTDKCGVPSAPCFNNGNS